MCPNTLRLRDDIMPSASLLRGTLYRRRGGKHGHWAYNKAFDLMEYARFVAQGLLLYHFVGAKLSFISSMVDKV